MYPHVTNASNRGLRHALTSHAGYPAVTRPRNTRTFPPRRWDDGPVSKGAAVSGPRTDNRPVRTLVKNALVVAVMVLALLLSPFALPITMVVRWVRGRATKTEQVVPGAEAQTSLRSDAQRLSS